MLCVHTLSDTMPCEVTRRAARVRDCSFARLVFYYEGVDRYYSVRQPLNPVCMHFRIAGSIHHILATISDVAMIHRRLLHAPELSLTLTLTLLAGCCTTLSYHQCPM